MADALSGILRASAGILSDIADHADREAYWYERPQHLCSVVKALEVIAGNLVYVSNRLHCEVTGRAKRLATSHGTVGIEADGVSHG